MWISYIHFPKGCAFCSRCDEAMKICLEEIPQIIQIEGQHFAACWMNVKKVLEEEGIVHEQ